MLKVLMIGWEFPPLMQGGLGVACEGLVKSMLKNPDIDLTLVLPHNPNNGEVNCKIKFPERAIIERTKYIPSLLRAYSTSESYQKEYSKLNEAHRKLYGDDLIEEVLRFGSRLREIFSPEELAEFDVIHAHDWLTYRAGIEAKRLTGKPLVIHVHATEFDRGAGMGINEFVYNLEKEGMNIADKIITVSNFTKNIVTSKYGIDPNKIQVVHNGSSGFYPKPYDSEIKNRVLFAGRITSQKGPEFFVRTARRVVDVRPNTEFVVMGSGDQLSRMMELARDLNLGGNIIFTAKPYKHKEFADMLQQSDVFVMPSVSEPFGIVPLEAMVSGVPTIISKQSGISEVLNHTFKVDFWDIDKAANIINGILEHKELKSLMQSNGVDEALSLTWDKPAQECIGVYYSVRK